MNIPSGSNAVRQSNLADYDRAKSVNPTGDYGNTEVTEQIAKGCSVP